MKTLQLRVRGFEVCQEALRKTNADIILPTRGSSCSAGYDFYSPTRHIIKPGCKTVIWTDVKAYMNIGEVLAVFVRSSVGIKKGLVLANGTGIIDADYYENVSNDGNIGICLYNTSDNDVEIEVGERIAQGIFLPFLVADTGNTDAVRTGGIGSTQN